MTLEAMLMNPKRKKAKKAAKKARRKTRTAAQKKATKKMIAARKAALAPKKVKKHKKARKVAKKVAIVHAPKRAKRAKRTKKVHKAKIKNIKRTRRLKKLLVYPGAHVRIKNPRRKKSRKNPQFDIQKILHYTAGAGIAILVPKFALKLLNKVPLLNKVSGLAQKSLIGKLAVRGLMIFGGHYVSKKTKFQKAGKAIMISSVALAAFDLADNFLGISARIPMTSYLGLGEADGIEESVGEIEMAGIEESMGEIEMNGIQALDGFGADQEYFMN